MRQMPQLEDGLALIERGFFTFPISAGGKTPYPRSRGYKNATNDKEQFKSLWRPGSNLAIACQNVAILDVDPKNGGNESFTKITERLGSACFENIPTVVTPSGGRHYYFRPSAGAFRRRLGVLPGIDILAQGGYAVAPPSSLSDGTNYRWEVADGADREFPEEILDLAPASQRKAQVRPSDDPHSPEGLNWAEGTRNRELTRLAGRLRLSGYSCSLIIQLLTTANEAQCRPQLSRVEVKAIAESISRYGPGIGDGLSLIAGWQSRGCKGNALALLVALVRGADERGRSSPNLTQLLRGTGLSESTFYSCRSVLMRLGALRITPRGSSASTVYDVQRIG